ncbi:hypothetical protein [Roseibium aggregatum]|uniref:Uncharacterized protein n=1 Tax=Roseibium aggregatum TaxID=187304 RepID=A0A939J7L6_9HYPH|nr:hypothetical protein [Roseibium aggregatum]MBN9673964.1 hypothetical protein [Roseibium aggregatum]
MKDRITSQISTLLNDETRSRKERVEGLIRLREDARALERAATEGPMAGPEPSGELLRKVDRALERLGYDEAAQADEFSAATL